MDGGDGRCCDFSPYVYRYNGECFYLGVVMSTMNSEVYTALIDAGSSEEKAKAAAVSVTDYERDINEVKADLKVIKWGIVLIIAAEVMPALKDIFA